jgi:predicted dehydrogenase
MTQRLAFGFIGAGEIAVASARAVRDSANATLVAVHDTREDLARDVAQTFECEAATSLEALLADPAVAAVYICVPHLLHRELAVRAADAGKHVFVEKPMGMRPDDSAAIVDACRRAGVTCGVPFVARNAGAYRRAPELIASGAIGDVTGFRITFRDDKGPDYWSSGLTGRVRSDWRQSVAEAGGGVLIMNTIHDLDAILWITGLDVERVQGVVANYASPGDVEDFALAILTCAGGAFGSLEAGTSFAGERGPNERWVNRIYGRAGQILLPSPWEEGGLALFSRDEGEWRDVEVDSVSLFDGRRRTFEEFSAAVLSGSEVPIPGEDGLRASRIVHAIYESARRGEPVPVASS